MKYFDLEEVNKMLAGSEVECSLRKNELRDAYNGAALAKKPYHPDMSLWNGMVEQFEKAIALRTKLELAKAQLEH